MLPKHRALRPRHSVRLLRSALLCSALSLLLDPSDARAILRTWTDAGGGSAATITNWAPPGVPTTVDELLFDLTATYLVTFGASVGITDRFSVQRGSVSFQFNSPHSHTGAFSVGTTLQNPVTLDLVAGDLTLTSLLTVGRGVGRDGTLRITGDGTNVVQDNTGSGFAIGEQDGVGRMVVRDGGRFETNGIADIGSGTAAAQGTLRVTGEGTTRRSSFTALENYTQALFAGRAGSATIEVLDGGLLDVRRQLVMAPGSGSVASLRVGGVGATDSARVIVAQDLMIARNRDAGAAGAASVVLEPGGVIEVADSTVLFDDTAGGTGTLTLSAGSRFATGSLVVRNPAVEVVHPAGTLQVIGGTLATNVQTYTVNSTTGSPQVELLSGARFEPAPGSGTALDLGTLGLGRMLVHGGSNLNMGSRGIRLGTNSTGDGVLELDASSITSSGPLSIGTSGRGTVVATNGSTGSIGDLTLGLTPGGAGTLTLSGSSTTLDVTGPLHLGGSGSAAGGVGTILVDDGADLRLLRTGGLGFQWPQGTIEVRDGASLELAGTLTMDGRVSVAGGRTDGGVFLLRAGAVLESDGLVNSSCRSLSDTTMRIRATDDAFLGRSDDPDGFQLNGTLLVNEHHVILRDADSSRVGSVWLAGGTLSLGPGGGSGSSSGVIAGSGTIFGRFRNRGSIAADAVNGLTFMDTLESYGRPISGRLRFANGGGFRGWGTLSGSVIVDPGATVVNEGPLTFGDLASPGTIQIDGFFDAGSSDVTCLAADTVRVGGVIELDQTTWITAPLVPCGILASGRLQGIGRIPRTTVLDGSVAPGLPAGAGFGTLTLDWLIARATARFEIEIGSLALGQFDRLAGSTRATLAGTLDIRRAGFVVSPGDSVQILDYPVVTGTFATLLLDGEPADGAYEVRYRPNGVWVVFPNALLDAPDATPRGSAALRFGAIGSPGHAPALELALPEPADVCVEIFDLSGRRVATPMSGHRSAGVHRIGNLSGVIAAGEICFARVRVTNGSRIETRTVRLVRTP